MDNEQTEWSSVAQSIHRRVSGDDETVEFVFASSEHVFPSAIHTERLRLKRISYETVSIKQVYELLSDLPNYTTQYVGFSELDCRIDAKEYIDDAVDRFESGESAGYAIIRIGDDEETVIGTTSFDPSWDQGIAESGIYLFEDYWNNGYSTERGEAMLSLAFEEYDFEYWMSKCDPENIASAEAIRNYVVDNGGREVGVLPNQVKLNDEYEDILYFVISRDEYYS